jgi:manganese/zinc/iron transport system permease protein
VISLIVIISLIFSPQGLLREWIRKKSNQRAIHLDSILTNLYILAKTHEDLTHPHDINTFYVLGAIPPMHLLKKLENEGLITNHKNNEWGLTTLGISKAEQVLQGGIHVAHH